MGTPGNYQHGVLSVLLTVFILTSCATAPKTTQKAVPEVDKPPAETTKGPVPTKEEMQSLEIFTEILHLTRSTNDRKSILPDMERLYTKIIRDYPDAPLVHESYWKLIAMYVNDYSPPQYEKAEALYNEFLQKHPESFARGFIEDELANSYYSHAEWSKLIKFTTPSYKAQTEGGPSARPSLLYMHSEANYKLGNREKAEKGFRILADSFPEHSAGKRSLLMLEKMKEAGK